VHLLFYQIHSFLFSQIRLQKSGSFCFSGITESAALPTELPVHSVMCSTVVVILVLPVVYLKFRRFFFLKKQEVPVC
jgi:hypothetical protein